MAILSYSAQNIIDQAFRDLGVLRTGQGAPTDLVADALISLNQLIDSWLIEELMTYCIEAQIFPFAVSKNAYTIGPSGADFIADRPVRIEDANTIMNTVSPTVRIPISIITVDEWAAISVRDIPNDIPQYLYYDSGFNNALGYGTINIWGMPQVGYELEIFVWKQLRSFPDLTTPIIFPPAYALALRKNLAIDIAPMCALYLKHNDQVGPGKLLALVEKQAQTSKSKIMTANIRPRVLRSDPAFDGMGYRGGFNWKNGMFQGR